MFVISGATGQVGGAVAKTLLESGLPVRVIERSAAKAGPFQSLGCEIAVVPDIADVAGLSSAFADAEAVFLINPPNYDPEPGFPDTHVAAAATTEALRAAHPRRAVFLSSIGAHVSRFNLLNNAGIFEAALRALELPVTILRPAWFMENAAGDLESARTGIIDSYLQPLDHKIAMVSVEDIGRVAADLLQDGRRAGQVVELTGPERYCANEVAACFAQSLGRSVVAKSVPSASWEALFRNQGMRHPAARIAMLDGFNADWLDFEGGNVERRVGNKTLGEALQSIVRRELVN